MDRTAARRVGLLPGRLLFKAEGRNRISHEVPMSGSSVGQSAALIQRRPEVQSLPGQHIAASWPGSALGMSTRPNTLVAQRIAHRFPGPAVAGSSPAEGARTNPCSSTERVSVYEAEDGSSILSRGTYETPSPRGPIGRGGRLKPGNVRVRLPSGTRIALVVNGCPAPAARTVGAARL
jgi:hypothetical protein